MPQPPNIQRMLQQAQEMMAQQQEAQEALKNERVEASAGGGMVKVVASGDMRIQELRLDPDAVDPEDVEMLQDLLIAAVNTALTQAEELAAQKLQGGAEGFDPASALESLGLGGGLGGLGGLGGPGGAPGGPGAGGAPGGGNRAARRAQKKR